MRGLKPALLAQPVAEAAHPLGGRDNRPIAEVILGARDVVIVRVGELRGEEPGHSRFGFQASSL